MSHAETNAEAPRCGLDNASDDIATKRNTLGVRHGNLRANGEVKSELKEQSAKNTSLSSLRYLQYDQSMEDQYLTAIRQLISKDLSEPYSIYVYRYFLYQWGHLCFMVRLCMPVTFVMVLRWFPAIIQDNI